MVGGVFERLVKFVKRCLKKAIGQARLTLDEISTVLTEIESVINSRPISYISSDDLEEPLTPSHLLTGRRLIDFPDHLCREPEEFESTPDVLSKRARYLQEKITHFWKRWRQEYLTELRESHRYHHGKTIKPNPVTVGEVVLIHKDGTPRSFWKLGRVKELLVGPDGKPRGAILKVAGKGQRTTLKRSLRLLYPLEVTGQPDNAPSSPTQDTNCSAPESGEDNTEPTRQPRPRRKAAVKARQTFARLLQDSDLED